MNESFRTKPGTTPNKKVLLFGLALLWVFSVFTIRTVDAQADSTVDYLTDIKPMLRDKCFSCHSSINEEGGLRLDAASLIKKGGDSGPAFVARLPAESLILERIAADDDNRMPPAEDGARLTAAEVAKLTSWIKGGGVAPDEKIPEHPSQHWAFLPLEKAAIPSTKSAWVRNDIDRFLADLHQRRGIRAVGQTSRSMLLRRVSLALTGLPPTPAERREFLDDKSEAAFENAVDRLLESPRYGERWARHFMDIWRYSDPSGYGNEIRDGREHIWRWRDWIVESLNADKGYDRMIVEMLAADEVAPEDQDALRATGFLARNWYKFNRNVWLDNTVEHSTKAFLGLTMNCARCHSHKYDPFSQDGYYRMRAIFETHDIRDDPLSRATSPAKNTPGDRKSGGMLVRRYDAHLERPTFPFLMGDENRPDKENSLLPGLPELFGDLKVESVSFPVTTWYPALREENRESAMKAARGRIVAANSALEKARGSKLEAEKKLAYFRQPEPKGKQPNDSKSAPIKSKSPPVKIQTVLSDDFSKLDLKRWKVEGGNWLAKNGRIIQTVGTTNQHRLISQVDHPRDFRAKLKLRITGGETYKSVGIGFDGMGKAMNAVYLSVSGPKVQFTLQGNEGRWQYPVQGMAAHSVKVGQDYLLEVVVKEQLLNVLVDGELKVAFKLPKRKPGRLSVWAFSATAEFDQLDVTTLPPNLKLAPLVDRSAASPKPVTKKDLQLSFNVAVAREKAAVAHRVVTHSSLKDLEARMSAEMVKYGLAKGNVTELANAAGLASRQHALNLIAEKISQSELKSENARQKQETTNQATRAKAAAELQASEKQTVELRQKYSAAKAQLENGSKKYAFLGKQYPKTSSGRRVAFAKWITARENPLTARVLVNHVWLRHFGTPLVERTFDFGLRSQKPQHAQLLDFLALKFIKDGWSLKKLHKYIVMSGIYQRSSSPTEALPATQTIDPDNLAFWRMNVRRMEAEVVRDSVLSLGNSLDVTMGGPPVEHTKGQTSLRRSLYFRQDKERQMTFLSLFDGAKVNECYERKSTVAPQQALAMFNSDLTAAQAKKIAANYSSVDGETLVEALFEHVLCRKPTADEKSECTQFLDEFQGSVEARQQLVLVLLNHNDYVTIR